MVREVLKRLNARGVHRRRMLLRNDGSEMLTAVERAHNLRHAYGQVEPVKTHRARRALHSTHDAVAGCARAHEQHAQAQHDVGLDAHLPIFCLRHAHRSSLPSPIFLD